MFAGFRYIRSSVFTPKTGGIGIMGTILLKMNAKILRQDF